jgi:hypothetical protein
MKIRRRAFSNLSSLLEIQGFTYPVLEKTMGENTIVADQVNGEKERAIRVREFVPVTFTISLPENLNENFTDFNGESIIRKGRVVKDFTLHIEV